MVMVLASVALVTATATATATGAETSFQTENEQTEPANRKARGNQRKEDIHTSSAYLAPVEVNTTHKRRRYEARRPSLSRLRLKTAHPLTHSYVEQHEARPTLSQTTRPNHDAHKHTHNLCPIVYH